MTTTAEVCVKVTEIASGGAAGSGRAGEEVVEVPVSSVQ